MFLLHQGLTEDTCTEIPENKPAVISEFVKPASAACAQQISYCELGKKAEIKSKNESIRHCEGAACSSEESSTSVCKMLDMNMQEMWDNLLSAGELSPRRGQAPLSIHNPGDLAVKHKVSEFQNVPAGPRMKSWQRCLYRTLPTPRHGELQKGKANPF